MPRIIVRRGCVETFAELQEMFAHETDVQVLWDRRDTDQRIRERRATARRGTSDRRRHERRRRPSQAWLALDFLVVKD